MRLGLRAASWATTALCFAWIGAACSQTETATPNPALTIAPTASTLRLDQALLGIAWLDDDRVVVGYAPDKTSHFRLATVDLRDGSFTPLASPVEGQCDGLRLGNPYSISRSEIELTQVCLAAVGSHDPDTTSIQRLNTLTGTYSFVASVGEVPPPSGQIAINADSSHTLVAMGNLCAVIVEATSTGSKSLPIKVGSGASSFSLGDIEPGPDCSQRGWADFPTWSPTTNDLAFFAAPAAIGVDGPARSMVPANLYIVAPGSDTAEPILADVLAPRALAYAPNGQSLAFSGEIAGKRATWILDRITGRLRSVYAGDFDWLAWSRDGTMLAGLVTQADPGNDKIVVVRLSHGLAPS